MESREHEEHKEHEGHKEHKDDLCMKNIHKARSKTIPLPHGERLGEGATRISVLIISFISIIFLLSPSAYAWGSITHIAICREVSSSPDFLAGGHSPDMIALNSVVTGSDYLDYAHGLNEAGGSFGQVMASRGGGAYGRGWLAHQLADSVVHGANGYSATKTVFTGIPERYMVDLGHGATELIIDAIILKEIFNRSVPIYMPDKARLIHETAVACYNNGGGRIPRRHIISCHLAEGLAIKWEAWLNTNIYIADLMIDEPWFKGAENGYQDYRPFFERSVGLITSEVVEAGIETVQPRWLYCLARVILPAAPARAAEALPDGDKTAYYSFVMKLSERARVIGGGKITKESVRQAIAEAENTSGLTDKEKLWAKTIQEMTIKDNRDLSAVTGKVTAYGKEIGPKQGAAGGRTGSEFLPCLPFAVLISLMAMGLFWFARRASEGR